MLKITMKLLSRINKHTKYPLSILAIMFKWCNSLSSVRMYSDKTKLEAE